MPAYEPIAGVPGTMVSGLAQVSPAGGGDGGVTITSRVKGLIERPATTRKYVPGMSSRAVNCAGAAESQPAALDLVIPMDETIVRASLDLSGRPYFVFDGSFPRERVGELPTELVPHFFRSLCETAGLNLHLQVRGENTHHMVEACFKVVARALRAAIRREGFDLPSTKGTL